MSASSKKKLRKEQNAAQLTERQRKEQAEAKNLKVTSIIFVSIMAVVVIIALAVMAVSGIKSSGILEKTNTVATIGEHKINAVEANYYFTDMLSQEASQYTSLMSQLGSYSGDMSYADFAGLDPELPLDEQQYDEQTTWADYYMNMAMDQAKADYTLYDEAMKNGFTISEEVQATLDNNLSTLEMYAMFSGVSSDDYLRNMYGAGANVKSYKAYLERATVASAYYDSLTYDDAAIREFEADKFNDFSSFSFASYTIATSKFESAEDAAAEAKKAAESLKTATSVEELDAAIAALEINAEVEDAHSTIYENTMYTAISKSYRDWLADSSRKANDIEIFANETTTTDADGNETTTIDGYYVIMFQDACDNTQPLGNVRHLLVQHSHEEGEEHSDNDMVELKAEADGYLETWLAGDKTEESFIELVKEHSDDSSAADGGLFENIGLNSNYVAEFQNWATDPNRKEGDAEVIETQFGYHVMFYVGGSDMSCRDELICKEIAKAWREEIVAAANVTILDTSRINFDKVFAL